MREAQLLQGAVDRIVGYRDAELLMQLHDQIARPPAHHAVHCRDRTGLDDVGEERLVLGAELAGRARRRLADEAFGPLFVEPYHPVPQRLAVHAAGFRRLRPRPPVKYRRERQQPPRLGDIFPALGQPPKFRARIVRPQLDGAPHGKRPSVCHLESRHR